MILPLFWLPPLPTPSLHLVKRDRILESELKSTLELKIERTSKHTNVGGFTSLPTGLEEYRQRKAAESKVISLFVGFLFPARIKWIGSVRAKTQICWHLMSQGAVDFVPVWCHFNSTFTYSADVHIWGHYYPIPMHCYGKKTLLPLSCQKLLEPEESSTDKYNSILMRCNYFSITITLTQCSLL